MVVPLGTHLPEECAVRRRLSRRRVVPFRAGEARRDGGDERPTAGFTKRTIGVVTPRSRIISGCPPRGGGKTDNGEKKRMSDDMSDL